MAVDTDTSQTLWRKDDAETVDLIGMSTAVRNENLVFQNPREIVCLNATTGKVRWRTSRPSPQARPVWGTPTVVITDDVVLSADHLLISRMKRLSFRIHDPAEEQDAAGLVVADEEQEWMVGPEDRWSRAGSD